MINEFYRPGNTVEVIYCLSSTLDYIVMQMRKADCGKRFLMCLLTSISLEYYNVYQLSHALIGLFAPLHN